LGIGLISPAPGTVGALMWGMPLAWAIGQLPGRWWQLGVIVALNLVGIPLATCAGRQLGGMKDNQAIVWDEIVTVPITFLVVPLTGWWPALVGFLVIRTFDISKPPPIRRLERLPEGMGVMADDLLAGVYAMIAMALVDQVVQFN
jgi:phosphatidylglycerophosphatase A